MIVWDAFTTHKVKSQSAAHQSTVLPFISNMNKIPNNVSVSLINKIAL